MSDKEWHLDDLPVDVHKKAKKIKIKEEQESTLSPAPVGDSTDISRQKMIGFYWRIMHDKTSSDANKIQAAKRVDELMGFVGSKDDDNTLVRINMNFGDKQTARDIGDEVLLEKAVTKDLERLEDEKAFVEAKNSGK